jgi:Rrf2 family protein
VKLSNKGRYGVRAMFDVAFHGDGAAAQIKDVAERQGIPARFLEQIFQDLRRAGLVSSKRGPRGGYQLQRPAREISLGDVLRALEGSLGLFAGEEEPAREPTSEGEDAASVAVSEAALRELSQRIEGCFNEINLEDLCDRAQRQGLRKAGPAGYVYVI